MMLTPAAIDAVAEVLEPESRRKFYRDSHGALFDRMLAMHRAGLPVDVVTVRDSLTKQPVEGIDLARVLELGGMVPAAANAGHYAEIVRESWMKRAIIRIGHDMQTLGLEGHGEATDLFQQAAQMFDSARGAMERERDVVITMFDAAEYLDDKFKNPPDLTAGVPTPWGFLPQMKGGRLYVLGGYEKDGKTVQAHHFFRAAIEAGIPAGFVTLEMNWQDLVERMAANMGLPAKRVESGRFADQMQREKAFQIVGKIAMLADQGRIFDAPGCSVADLRRYVKTYGLKFLLVDHLHQFSTRPEYERQDLEAIVRGIWQVSREFDIPVLLMAQLSRSGDKKHPFPRPTAAQLRGSGMIEKLAWAVWFIWRERDEMNLPTEDGLTEFIIALNRSGGQGMRKLRFYGSETRFEEIAREG